MKSECVLVIGASSGIDYHLAQYFARDHHGVILVSHTQSDLEQVAQEFKTKFNCLQVTVIAKDLSKLDSSKELYDEIKQKYQLPIDFLVNNAGIGFRGQI
ncbi:unnamed protein product [Rotaria sp. Silwood1]|nr:unnamed protein product [Rotaria sp. Silwood1]CAF1573345.1 unnamed protein product [Rotaria sp. Silwood1]CAF3707116.1 unnamed protein product [Rotaria sp. Silwood1]CAF3739701.1 unnamed protein product [Rotaria sp. Silwood1]CAF3758030.1 unnamed protein product [Rotaria sp. Silwood1]